MFASTKSLSALLCKDFFFGGRLCLGVRCLGIPYKVAGRFSSDLDNLIKLDNADVGLLPSNAVAKESPASSILFQSLYCYSKRSGLTFTNPDHVPDIIRGTLSALSPLILT